MCEFNFRQLALIVLLPLLASSCSSSTDPKAPKNLHPKTPQLRLENVYVKPLPFVPNRVALLPIYTTQTIGESQKDMDTIFRGELNKMLRFEVVSISRAELSRIINKEQIPSTEAIPPESLRALREKYGVDALMLIDFTQYRPYRPLAIGVRAKLVDMTNMQVLWSSDNVIDAADPVVASAAMQYSGEDVNNPAPGASLVLQSPRRFAAFTAHQVFASIPSP